jgi:NAD(P)H-hydrate epimerase
LLHVYQSDSRPLIVDADALFALSQRPAALAEPGGPRVLTPHAGEFARLISQPVEFAGIIAKASAKDRMRAAVELAQRDATHQTVVVLKGHQTIIADSDHLATNGTGNPGMATGGTGDVLTGVITGLICQGVPPFEAARLGVHVHGLAGDLAAKNVGQTSLIASDVIDCLPAAFQSLESKT